MPGATTEVDNAKVEQAAALAGSPCTAGARLPPPLSPPLPPFPAPLFPPLPPTAKAPSPPSPPMPPLATLVAKVVEDTEKARPGLVEDAATDSLAARASRASRASDGVLASGCGTAVKTNADAAVSAGTAVSADGLVRGDGAVGNGERSGRVEDPAPLAILPGPAITSGSPELAAQAGCSRRTVRPGGDIVQDRHRGKRHLAAGVQEPASRAAARPCWIVTFEIDTLPPRTWKTRSTVFPSMMVLEEPFPLIVRFA